MFINKMNGFEVVNTGEDSFFALSLDPASGGRKIRVVVANGKLQNAEFSDVDCLTVSDDRGYEHADLSVKAGSVEKQPLPYMPMPMSLVPQFKPFFDVWIHPTGKSWSNCAVEGRDDIVIYSNDKTRGRIVCQEVMSPSVTARQQEKEQKGYVKVSGAFYVDGKIKY